MSNITYTVTLTDHDEILVTCRTFVVREGVFVFGQASQGPGQFDAVAAFPVSFVVRRQSTQVT